MRANSKAAGVALMILGALALAGCRGNSSRIVDPLPAGIDLTSAQIVEVRDANGQVVLTGTFVDKKAPLTGADPKAKGLAELEIEKVGTGLKQEIEANVENLPASATFKLIVDGKEVATFMTSDGGNRAMKYTRKDGA